MCKSVRFTTTTPDFLLLLLLQNYFSAQNSNMQPEMETLEENIYFKYEVI